MRQSQAAGISSGLSRQGRHRMAATGTGSDLRGAAAGQLVVLSTLVFVLLTSASPTPDTGGLGTARTHNLTEGTRSATDYHMYQGVARVNGSAVHSVQFNETCYPRIPSNVTPHSRISAFSVLDLVPRGEGGYPQVVSGGIGHPQVCIRLSSQPHGPYHFMVDVWGTYSDAATDTLH